MNQTAASQPAKQPAKKGRPRRPTMQPARIPPETMQQLDALAQALNAIRAPGSPVIVKGRLAAAIIAKYGADYVAAHAQDAAQRTQEALGAAQDATPASAAPAAPQAPQEPAEAALPLAQPTAPRTYAPHYFAVHGEVR